MNVICIFFALFTLCQCCEEDDFNCLCLHSIASLQEQKPGTHFCGGAVITPRTVLTVASCILNKNARNIYVVVGIQSLNQNGSRYKAETLRPHPNYMIQKLAINNVGLVITKKPIEFNDRVTNIRLPIYHVLEGDTLHIVGWKSITYAGSLKFESTLRDLYVTAISKIDCESSYIRKRPIFDFNICTKMDIVRGSCLGEYGSPVFDTQNHVVGLVSWDKYCAPSKPDVYISVYYYINWIQKNMV